MLIASKYEEIYAPTVRDLVFVSARAYTRESILEMETHVFKTLTYRLPFPTAFVFLQRLLSVVQADGTLASLAHYYAERTLQEYYMLARTPSVIAAAALFLALRATGRKGAWTPALQHYSRYTEAELWGAVVQLRDLMDKATTAQLQAVRKKYTQRFDNVASLALPSLE